MKRRGAMRRSLAWLLSLVLCLGMLPGAALAVETTYTKVTSVEEIIDGGSFVLVAQTDEGGQALSTNISGKIDGASVTVSDFTLSGSEIPVWTVSSSGDGVSFYNGSEYLGYGSGTNFTQLDTAYQWNVTEQGTDTFRFTASGASNRAIAWQEANNNSPSNRFGAYAVSNAGGADYVFDLLVFKATTSSDPGGDVAIATPQATPQAGAVASGTAITLTCATADAQIYYTLDGSDPSDLGNENRQLYSASNQPVITEACTLKAVAVKDGVSSAVQSIDYTIQSDEPAAAPIAGGDQVVIYNPVYKKALSSEKTGFYNVGTDITVSEGTVSGYGENDVWTVVANADGTFSFQQDGKNIGLAESHSSMDLDATYDDWKLIDLGNGLYNIQNTGRGNYMEWYEQYGNWSTYNSSSADTDGQFQLSFYKVTGDIPEPEPEAPITAGGTVVIYAPSNMMALSATVKNTYYPIGVEVTVEDGALTGYGNTEIWTVGGDAENGWTFKVGGQAV